MPTKNKSGARNSVVDPDDAPRLDKAFFDRAEIVKGGKILQRGRPPLRFGKAAVKLRIDVDVLARFRAGGPGWQTRMNEVLRRHAPRKRKTA
jgi:uncharacterized protein (DUF4415 family)